MATSSRAHATSPTGRDTRTQLFVGNVRHIPSPPCHNLTIVGALAAISCALAGFKRFISQGRHRT